MSPGPTQTRRPWRDSFPAWLEAFPAFAAVVLVYALWRFGLTWVYYHNAAGGWSWRTHSLNYVALFVPMLLLGPLVFWTAHRCPLGSRSRGRVLGAHLLSMAVYCLASYGSYLAAHTLLLGDPGARLVHLRQVLKVEPLYIASLGWTFFLMGAALAHALIQLREARSRALREAALEARLAQAQLRQLKSQLQPHFLFNTHSAISGLMSTDVPAARRMLNRLSDFLRMSLQDSGENVVPLRRELEFTDLYLEIQQSRFTDRLRVVREVEPGLQEWPVPHLLLQPLVENALKHGLGPRIEPGTIWIAARREGEGLLIRIEDDGVGPKASGRTSAGEGFGLRNARDRLRQLYGEAAALEAGARSGGGFRVTVRIPARPTLFQEQP